MATHSSLLARRIPQTEKPGGLQSIGRKESDTTERLHFTRFILHRWRRKRQPTPVFFPGESHGQGSWLATVRGVAKSRTQPTKVTKHTGWSSPFFQGARVFYFMTAVTTCSDFRAKKIKSVIVFPSISHEVMGPDKIS